MDNAGNTAGDIALSLNDEASYRAIRDAGIRSGVCVLVSLSIAKSGTELILRLLASHGAEADALILKEEDDTALGSTDKFLSSRLRYMSDELGQDICLLQSGDTEIGVMMGWERGISAFSFGSPISLCMLTGGSMLSAENGVQDVP